MKKRKRPSNEYFRDFQKLRKTIVDWNSIYSLQCVEERTSQLVRIDVIGSSLCQKYSWAIPDDQSLRVLKEFAPLIEIGAGKGYWASLLLKDGVDIVCFDRNVENDAWAPIFKGGPEILGIRKIVKGRNLVLCYPDEDGELALECLKKYKGEYIIHIGEMIMSGTLSSPQAPWGRTTSASFQVRLAEEFHCLLTAALPCFPFARDIISVWKRTQWTDCESTCSAPALRSSGESHRRSDRLWARIPEDERLPQDAAAPCLAHLLNRNADSEKQ